MANRLASQAARLRAENAVVEAIHAVAARSGYAPEILPEVAASLLPEGADEDARGRKLAEVQQVYARRFHPMEAG